MKLAALAAGQQVVPPPPPLAPAAPPCEPPRVVAWQARLPPDSPGSVHAALQQLFPDHYPSATAAKRAVRRREVLVEGRAIRAASDLLQGGELVQCLQRQGGLQPWPPPGPAEAPPTAGQEPEIVSPAAAAVAAADPARGYRLGVLYEDEHLACVVKPPGIPTDTTPAAVPKPAAAGSEGGAVAAAGAADEATAGGAQADSGAAGEHTASAPQPGKAVPSAYSLLTLALRPTRLVGALRRPRHVHRLDEPTGGLLLAAKTRRAQVALSAAFEQREVCKRYRSLVWGRLEGRGVVRYSLMGKRCETLYEAVQHTLVDPAALGALPNLPGLAPEQQQPAAIWVTTVDLWLGTGRHHQLRRHMALLGHPMLGEPRYSFGYGAQRLQSGQRMEAQDHLKLADGTGAGAATSVAVAEGEGREPRGWAGVERRPMPAAEPQTGGALPAAAAGLTRALDLRLCLWAVELRLDRHPATGEPLTFCIPEPPSYAAIRARLDGSAPL